MRRPNTQCDADIRAAGRRVQNGRLKGLGVLALLGVVATCGGESTAPDPVPAKVAFVAPPSAAVAGAALSPSIQVAIQDANGATVAGSRAAVTIAITSGTGAAGATLAGTVSKVAVDGIATFQDLTIAKAGEGYSLTAGSGNLAAATSSTFAVVAGQPSRLAVTAQPSAVTAGAAVSPGVQVAIHDAFGNSVTTSTASVTIAISNGTGPGGAVLGGTLTRTAIAGVATFGDLTVDKAASGYSLTMTATGMTPAVSGTFSVSPGSPAKLVVGVQPSGVTAGAAISPAVQIAVHDVFGNAVTTALTSVTVAISDGTGAAGAVLSGTATQSPSNGTATFSNLSIDKSGTGFTLTATATGLTSATTSAFPVSHGAASKTAVAVQPSAVTAGSAISAAVQIAIRDTHGNAVTNSTASVTVAITAGSGTAGAVLGGTTTQSAVNGIATFTNLTIDKSGTGYTLTATAIGLTGLTSAAFEVNHSE